MPIADGETVTIGGRRWRVITARGHSPEHACLFSDEARVLIAGDQVLPKITTNVSVWPERPHENPLRYYLDSLARFLTLPADTLVLPSHGLPFRGLHHRLSTLVQHHDARLAEAADASLASWCCTSVESRWCRPRNGRPCDGSTSVSAGSVRNRASESR